MLPSGGAHKLKKSIEFTSSNLAKSIFVSRLLPVSGPLEITYADAITRTKSRDTMSLFGLPQELIAPIKA